MKTTRGVAQDYHYKYKNYTVSDGLPSSQIYQILQDKKGNIWFGTDRGVVSYNGDEFKIFTTEHGLASNIVFYLKEHSNGTIWAYGMNRTFSYFENGVFKPFPHNDYIKKSLAPGYLPNSVDVTSSSISLFAHSTIGEKIKTVFDRKGMHLNSDRKNAIYLFENNPENIATSLQTIVSEGTVYMVDKEGKERFIDSLTLNPLVSGKVERSCLNEVNGDHYFSFLGMCFRYDGEKIHLINRFESEILELAYSDHLGLMVGTTDGLWVDVEDSLRCKKMLEGFDVSSILQDRQGALWVGTLFNGLFYFPPNTSEIAYLSGSESINRITGDENYLMFTTQNGWVFGEKNNRFNHIFTSKEQTPLKSFYYHSDQQKLYFKTNTHYYSFTTSENEPPKKITLTAHSFFDNARYCDVSDLYASAHADLILFFPKPFALNDMVLFKNQQYYFHNIGQKDSNTFILGAKEGAYTFHLPDSTFKPYHHELDFFKSPIRDQLKINDSIFVFASETSGLMIQVDSLFIQFKKRDGLVSNNIRKMHYTGDRLIAGSKQGISLLHFSGDIRNITNKNGLTSNDINDFFYRNDTLWVASGEGINRIALKQPPNSPVTCQFNSLRIDGTPEIASKFVEMNYSREEIDFSILALDFTQIGDIRYKFRLTGHEKSWNYTTDNDIHYSGLGPGIYQFEIAYLTAESIWSQPIILFHLKKHKPFWLKAWFIVLFCFFVAGLFALLFYLRFKRVKKRAEANYYLIDLERKALQSQMNPHFIFNSLTSIQSLMVEHKVDASIKYLVRFSKLTRMALSHSTQKFVLLNDEIALLKNYVELEQLRFSNQFDFEIESNVNPHALMIPPTVIQPFVENAILHGLTPQKKQGILRVILTQNSKNTLVCTVDDNGVGRKNKKRSETRKSMGIHLIRERLRLLLSTNGEVITFIDKQDPPGTTVKIIIPFQEVYESPNR